MENILRSHDIASVDVVGIATDYCVKETALDASNRGFGTRVYLNCMKGVDLEPGDTQAAIDAMVSAGVEVRRQLTVAPKQPEESLLILLEESPPHEFFVHV